MNIMIPPVELFDWSLDAFALLLSIFIAKRVVDLSWREIGIITCCFVFYLLHEMWEASIIFPGTHRQFELWLVEMLLL